MPGPDSISASDLVMVFLVRDHRDSRPSSLPTLGVKDIRDAAHGLARPELPGLGTPWGTPTTIHYDEGAEVGYRWFAKTGEKPLYAFGHGLSHTSFGSSTSKSKAATRSRTSP